METIKEEPEDFGANSMMLNNIEQHPDTVGAGALVVRDVEDQSESDTMTSGETDGQSPTDDMSLDELEEFSDAFSAGALIERDSDEQSEASTVILADFNEQSNTAGTRDVAMAGAPELSPNANKSSPDSDSGPEEENQFALTPEPPTTPGGSSSLHYTILDSQDDQKPSLSPRGSDTCMACQEGSGRHFFGYCGPCAFQEGRWRLCDVCQRCLPSVGWRGLCFDCVPMTESERGYIWPPGTEAGSSAEILNGGSFSDNATSSFGSYFAGNQSHIGYPGVFPPYMTTQHAFPYGFLPQAAVMPPAPLPTAPFPQGPMFPSAFLGQPVQMMHVQQPMAVPAYYPPYVPVGYMPINYQAVYNVPNGHYGGPYPPWATDTWNGEMPDTNAQRMAAAEYPVRTQTPYPPRYLPRNGSGFEYTGMASQTPDREHTSFMFEEPGTTNIPGSANRATTGSPRERRRTTREPFESAHSYSHRQQ
ncbi:hypothetical protein B0J15DRAFT_582646 [Fusarium solani]|uniref:Uncharacterized protein n=1 Tax=Fusarium solani TaxID=169388 RepID=A0A9P9HMY9_FUSSL|nr:uncharacterized protein B0J15DRAFT_582646 [Fusarium solani]KAH7260515.1 hypothetical protein B0J15DRAFT_582646 [Fusarium solani]